MNKTFNHARRLLELADEKNMTLEGLQALTNIGLLSDLFEATANGTLGAVDREAYKLLLGLDPSVFRVKLGGPETTDQIVATLGFPADELITQENFPLTPRAALEEDEIEIIDLGKGFTEEEGLQSLADAKLVRPTYEHAIRFAAQHGKATTSEKKLIVVFLHEPWLRPGRGRRVVCLCRHARCRRLRLYDPSLGFDEGCVLAGVRPRK